jgi:tRNA1Val (adenine37-N6)-methyltransferase
MLFKFKQFHVDQSGCAMKINTDGVLLGALVKSDAAQTILDIGTGTGVITLMLAQQFTDAMIDAVEIDTPAADTARKNFQDSKFSDRLKVYPVGFEQYFQSHLDRKYDLIVSNPPFYINSLTATGDKMNLAKHTDQFFFEELIAAASTHLTPDGKFWVVLPVQTAAVVKTLASHHHLYVQHLITIHSFADSDAHREIIILSHSETKSTDEQFIIYDSPKVYSEQYRETLKDFFTIF